jgi:hypothetical protein
MASEILSVGVYIIHDRTWEVIVGEKIDEKTSITLLFSKNKNL